MIRSFKGCICLLIALNIPGFVLASDFGDSATRGIKIIEGQAPSYSDILIMSRPNASGISFNNISRFYVDWSLKIANTADSYGVSNSQPAKLSGG